MIMSVKDYSLTTVYIKVEHLHKIFNLEEATVESDAFFPNIEKLVSIDKRGEHICFTFKVEKGTKVLNKYPQVRVIDPNEKAINLKPEKHKLASYFKGQGYKVFLEDDNGNVINEI